MLKIYIAHINEKNGKVQTIKEHSENTARICRDFAIEPLKETTYLMGLLHDVGKYGNSFQKRINGENIKAEHSACGANEAYKKIKGLIGLMAAYCIAGHHSGLPDAGVKGDGPRHSTLYGRMKRQFDDYSVYTHDLLLPETDQKQVQNLLIEDCDPSSRQGISLLVDKFAFFTRYCFSCLTDADSLDTAEFCESRSENMLHANFEACLNKVNEKLNTFTCTTELQKSRHILQEQVFKKTKQPAEIFLMNMPTGSGKTLCSVKFALEKAISENKKRIIYVIPYNSIIDQTVAEFEKIFGDSVEILRHQSSFSYEDEDGSESISEDYRDAAKNAAENWDASFIITTAVQFFESVYSHKKKRLRKLHNMADSIIIFDEAHLMPEEYLQPCLQAVAFITKYLNSNAVLMTATMPDYENLLKQYALPSSRILNLIDDKSRFTDFRKCRYEYLGELDKTALMERTLDKPSSLIVVNKKATAKELYELCGGKKYHLSTYMAACDRKRIIAEIKEELLKLEEDFPNLVDVPQKRRITIISTSLIEAGVDIDVHTVFRELAGLDNILQAGGRCNREGKRKNAATYVFSLTEENKHDASMRSNLTKGLFNTYEDISVPECISEYYERLLSINREDLQMNTMSHGCLDFNIIPFRTYGENFRMIKAATISIAVERDDVSRELIRRLRETGVTNVRKLQNYVCSVSQKDFEELVQQHVLDDYGSGIWCLTNKDYYDENKGIKFEGEDYFL